MFSYGSPLMAEQKQDDLLEPTYSSSVRIQDIAQRTCRRRWTTGRSGGRGPGISMQAARHDDDDDDDDIYVILTYWYTVHHPVSISVLLSPLCPFCVFLSLCCSYLFCRCPRDLTTPSESGQRHILQVKKFLLFLGVFHFTSPVRLNRESVNRVEMEFDLLSLAI